MKKLDLKLTASLVSFIVSLILLVCGQKAKVCIFLACLFLALCLVLYTLYRQSQLRKTLIATEQDLEENPPDAEEYVEIEKLKKKVIKKSRRLDFVFYTCAFLVVVAGIFSLF